MTRAVESIVAVAVLAAASAAPIVAAVVAAGRVVVPVMIVLAGLGYAAVLHRCALPGRGIAASVTVGAATVLGAAAWSNPVAAGVAWLLAFAVGWSIARRRSIGVVGTIAATYVVGAGVLATIFAVGGAQLSDSPHGEWDTAQDFVAIGWSVLAAVHGAMWLDEFLRRRIRLLWRGRRARSPEERPPQYRERDREHA